MPCFVEPGGQNAERQWRRRATDHGRRCRGAGRAERRKAMETLSAFPNALQARPEPGGQNAERQWRLLWSRCTGTDSICWSREGRTPKGNGDPCREMMGVGAIFQEPGGQNAERQWRPMFFLMTAAWVSVRAGRAERRKAMETHLFPDEVTAEINLSREGRTPKGNGDVLVVMGFSRRCSEPGGQNAERQWRLPAFDLVLGHVVGAGRAERRKAMETNVIRYGFIQSPD